MSVLIKSSPKKINRNIMYPSNTTAYYIVVAFDKNGFNQQAQLGRGKRRPSF